MNKVYKVIWSKVKNCYVVASELAKSHTKAPSSGYTKTVVAGLLACSLSCGVIMPVFAASYNAGGGTASGTDAIAIGSNSSATEEDTIAIGVNSTVSGKYSIVIGKDSVVTGENSGAIGEPNIVAGNFSYVIGNDNEVLANVKNVFIFGNNVNVSNGALPADWNTMTDTEKGQVTGEGAIALGDNVSISLTNKAAESRSGSSEGSPKIEHVVAIGDSAVIGEENAIAIGHGAKSIALNAFAVGDDAQATAEGANAIGHSARATSSFANALGYQAQAIGEGAAAFGQSAQATVKFATAFGRETRATAESATAVGNNAKAISQSAVAIGTSAMANGGGNTHAIAIGNGARVGRVDNEGTPTTGYGETIAIGGGAVVENTYGTVVGSAGNVTGQKGTAVGASASVTATNAVALGADSVADTANTVSVGSSSATRKIVNVTAGTANTDASTISQTGNQLALSGNTLSLKTATGTVLNSVTLDSGNTYSAGNGLQLTGTEFSAKAGTNVTVDANGISVTGNGVIDNGNAGLISGGTLYNEVNVASNGNYIVAGDTTAQNLGKLDTAIKNVDNSSIKSMTANGTTVTFTKGDGTTGTFTTQDNNTEYTAGDGLKLTGTEFSAKAGTNVTVDTNGISVAGNGTVASGDTGLISGGTLFTEGRVASNGNYVQANNTIAQNLTALDTKVKSNADAIVTEISNRSSADTALGNRISGTITDLSVNGTTITYTKENGDIGTITTQDNNTEYTAGNGLTLTGTEFTAKAGDHITVDANGISVSVDGAVANGNTGLVSGGDVYTAISAEATARENADSTLQTSITNEKIARESADSTLQTNINNEVTARENADTTLQTNINNEATARETADTTLQTNIDNLDAVAVKYDSATTKDKVTLEGTDGTTINNVKDGTLSATSKEAVNGSQLYTTNQALAQEVTDRTNADSALSNRIGVVADGTYNYIQQSSSKNVAENLVALDTQVKANADAIATNRIDYVSTNGTWEEWTDETKDAIMAKYGVTDEAGYEDLKLHSNLHNDGAVGADSIAIGKLASSQEENSIVLGNSSASVTKGSIALGNNTTAGSYNSENVAQENAIAIGNSTRATYVNSLAIGNNTEARGTNSVAVGTGAYASSNRSVAIGDEAAARYRYSIAIGGRTNDFYSKYGPNTGNTSGYMNNEGAEYGIAIGYDTFVNRERAVAIGKSATSRGIDAVAIGSGSEAIAQNSIALGSGSYANLENSLSLGKDAVGVLGDDDYFPELTRRIQHVTAGINDTDAVNVKQLNDAIAGAGGGGGSTGSENYLAGNNIEIQDVYDHKTVAEIGRYDLYDWLADAGINVDNSVEKTGVEYGLFMDYINDTISDEDKATVEAVTLTSTTNVTGKLINSKYIGINPTNAEHVDSNMRGEGAVGAGSTAIGIDTSATGENSIAIGIHATAEDGMAIGDSAESHSAGALAIGRTASATGQKSVAIGDSAKTAGNSAIAIGDTINNVPNSSIGIGRELDFDESATFSVMVGTGASANSEYGIVMGNDAHIDVNSANSISVGKSAFVSGVDSTSIGSGSRVEGSYSSAYGKNAKVNSGNYATALGSYAEVTATSGLATVVGSFANASADYASAFGSNTEASAEGATAVGRGAKATAENSLAIGAGAQVSESGSIALGAGSVANVENVVSLGKDAIGTEGDNDYVAEVTRKVTHVTAGEADTDAVNVKQLTDAIADVTAGVATYSAGNGLELDGTQFKAKAGTNVTVDANGISVNGNGAIESGNTGLIRGEVAYAELRPVASGNYISTSSTTAGNLTALDTQLKTTTDTLDDKANVSLDNITEDGENIVKTLAKRSINVTGDGKATVTKTDESGVDTYKVSVTANGTITENNADIVTGGTVYNALHETAVNIDDALTNKANKDASNVTDAQAWATKIGTGTVNSADTKLVTGATVAGETRVDDDGNYILESNTAGQNITALDTQVKANTDTIATNITDIANLKDLSNITTDGESVIRDIAQGSVKVVNGTNTTVTEGTDGNYKTYAVNVTSNGVVEENNTGIVTGGTVYSALHDNVLAFQDALDLKANKTLDNITDAGHSVIKSDAKSAINVVGGTNAEVVKTDVSGVDTYTVNVVGSGIIAQGNTGLVTGGDVYEAISSIGSSGSDIHYIGVDGDDASDNNYNGEGASGYRAIAIGHDASASYQDAIAIGSNTSSEGDGSIAMGVMSQANGNNTLALMSQSRAIPDGAMAIGYLATAEGGDSVVIGTNASTTERSSSSVAIGNTASTEGQASIAIGGLAKAEVNNSVVIGLNAKSEAITTEGTFGAVVIGVNGISNNGVAIGSDVDATGNTSVAIGPKAKSLGNNSVALGEQSSTAEYQGIAIGYKAQSTSNSAVAIGGGSEASGSFASIAVGPNAKAQGGGVAIGTASRTYEYGSVAIGPNARVVRGIDNSVAIGMDSWAEEEGVVSFGTAAKNNDPEKTRRLLHVTAGIDDTDAVNVGQLRQAIADAGSGSGSTYTAGNGVTISNENAISAKAGTNVVVDNTGINVVGNGTVTNENTGLVSGGTAYTELRPADGTYIARDNTTAQNLTALDTQVNSMADDLDNKANIDASNVTDVQAWGQKIATAEVAENDVRAVSGDTVYTALQSESTARENADIALSDRIGVVDTDGNYIKASTSKNVSENLVLLDNAVKANADAIATTNTNLDTKANVSLDNITEAGEGIVKTLAKQSVNVTGSGKATVTKTDVSGVDTYNVEVAGNGTVASGDSNLVTGGVVYDAIQDALAGGSGQPVDISGKADKNASNVTDAQAWASAIGTGTVDSADAKLVTGATVAGETRVDADGNYVLANNTAGQNISALDAQVKANADAIATNTSDITNLKDLSNITADGETVVKNLAKDAVKVIAGTSTTVTEGTDGDSKTYAVNVVKNGTITSGNEGVVTGGTVYDAIATAQSDINTALTDGLATKANISLDNLSDAGVTRSKEIAQEAIQLENGTNTTVTNRMDGKNRFYQVNVAGNGTIASGDTGLVTGDTVYNALQSVATDPVNVVAGDNVNIAESTVSGVKTFTVSVPTDGEVENNNTGIVNGGTVYNALQNQATSMQTALDGKANVDMDNLTNTGKSNVRQLAQQAVKVVAGNNTNVTVSTDGTYVTYAVNVSGNGIIDNEENRLVTGSTIYNEVRPAAGNYIRRANTVATNLTVLDTNLKDLSDRVDAIGTGTDLGAVHYDSDDKNVVTMAGTQGTKITNLKDAEISAFSTDAVTGKQLNATNTAINGLQGEVTALDGRMDAVETTVQQNTNNITNLVTRVGTAEQDIADTKQDLSDFKDTVNTQMEQKANAGLDNITEAGKDVIRELAKGTAQDAVQVVNGTNTVVNKNVVDGNNQYSVDVVVDGAIEEGNTGIVNGGTVYEAIKNIDAKSPHYMAVKETHRDEETYDGGATGDDSVAIGVASKSQGTDSVAIGHGSVASGEQSIAIGTGNQVTGNHSGAFGDPNDVSGDGSYAVGNDNTVSGSNTFVFGNNVTNASGNNTVVLGAGSDGSQDNVVSVGSAGAERKIVNVADGIIAQDSTDAVNGSQLYEVTKEVNKKANSDASNIDVQKFTDKLGTGQVAAGDNGLVKGGTVYNAIQEIRDTNIVPNADGTVLNVGPGSSAVAIDFTNSNGEGRVLKGVLVDPNDATSATNVGYVNAIGQNLANATNNALNRMDTKVNKVGANAAAMASLEAPPMDGDEKWAFSAAVGHYEGETAGAVGAFYRPQDNVIVNVRGSMGNGEEMIGAGVGIALQRGVSTGITKAKLAKAVNNQAQVIQEMKVERDELRAEREADRAKMAQQDKEIAELKAQMAELMKQVKKNNG